MKKRLSILISLALVALISVAVIVMVLVQVNYKPQINEPNSVIVTQNGSDNPPTFTKTENLETFKEILSQYEQSFTRSYLSAFFAGQVSGDAVVTQISAENFNNLTFTDFKVEFSFSSDQTLTSNGQDLAKKYNKIIFEVSDNSIYKELIIYFNQVVENPTNYYVVSTYALQNGFYDYLETLFE